MKKVFAVLAVAAFVLSLSLAVVARADDEQKVKGTVTKIDEAAKTITITAKDGTVTTVVVDDDKYLTKVKEGEKGEARFVVKDGKNMATKVRKLTEGCQ